MKYLTNLIIFLSVYCVQSIIAQPGWFQQTSGIATDLNTVSFITEDYGFAAGDGGVILKTTNGGSTWTPLTSGTTSDFYDVLLLDQNNGFVVGSGGTILRTTDGGSNWSPLTSGVSDNLFSISINGTFGLIGGGSQTILSTTNGGSSWNEVQSGFFGGGFWAASIINSSSGVVAGQNSIFQPMIASTTDSGGNWEFTPFYLNTNEGRLHGCHFFDINNGITIAAVWDGQGAVSRTTNGGINWITNLFPQALFGLDFPTSSTAYTVGYDGFILKSTNGGLNWETQNSGTNAWLKAVSFATSEVGYVVGEAGTILKTTAGGVIPVELTSFTTSVSGNDVTV
ncbi:MAG: YCF48-related protein, partial [Ignavibacteriaceae bacterium]